DAKVNEVMPRSCVNGEIAGNGGRVVDHIHGVVASAAVDVNAFEAPIASVSNDRNPIVAGSQQRLNAVKLPSDILCDSQDARPAPRTGLDRENEIICVQVDLDVVICVISRDDHRVTPILDNDLDQDVAAEHVSGAVCGDGQDSHGGDQPLDFPNAG